MKRIIIILAMAMLITGQAMAAIGYITTGEAATETARIVKFNGTSEASVYTISNHRLYGSYVLDYNQAFVVGMGLSNNAIILRTINGGTSWDSTIITTTDTLYSISFSNTVGYCCGVNGKIYKTIDNGASWSALTSGVTSNLRTIETVTSSIVFCAGDSGKILKTSDGGSNWTLLTLPNSPKNNINDLAFINYNVGWAISDSGKIHKTLTGGTTWVRQNSPTICNLSSISALDQNMAIIAYGDSVILKTIDGSSWYNIIPRNSYGKNDFKYCTIASTYDWYFARPVVSGPIRYSFQSVDQGLTFYNVRITASTSTTINGISVLRENVYNNRYITRLFTTQDIDSTFSYYTPPFLANNFGWFGLYVYSYGTTPRYKITLEGAPTLSDPFIAPWDSIVADSCGMAGFVNLWVQVRMPPGQYARFKVTGMSGNGANTTSTIDLYSWGQ